ncbi:MAG: hypothetical protein NVSMB22_26700 [Chloroflexota bacterium]
MLWIYAPHSLDLDATQYANLSQTATSVALGGPALSSNFAFAPTTQTIVATVK